MCRLFGVSIGVGFRGCRTCQNVGFVLLSCVPLFLSALSLCYWCVACKYGSASRFKGVLAGFMGFVWVCVFWCFAWLVWLLYACGVRRFYGLLRVCLPFVLLSFSFCLSFYLFASAFCPSPCLLCSGCLLLLSFLICVCVFFFPCGIYAKRAQILASSLGVLWVCL